MTKAEMDLLIREVNIPMCNILLKKRRSIKMLNCKDCKYMRISHYGGMYCYHPQGTTGDLSHRNTPPRWCPLEKY